MTRSVILTQPWRGKDLAGSAQGGDPRSELNRFFVPLRGTQNDKSFLMEINKQNWNNFILANGGSFLQSFEWGEFQEKFGRRVFRFSNCHPEYRNKFGTGFISGSQEALKQVKDDKIEWCAQFVEMTIPIIKKKYWYCPRAPLLGVQSLEFKVQSLKELIKIVGESARKEGVLFFRIGPEWTILDCHSGLDPESRNPGSHIKCGMTEDITILTGLGFKQIHYDIEPSQTLVLDIVKPEEELLAEMHEKWRYNIRLAERKGVKVKMVSAGDSDFEKYFEEFYRLVSEGTSMRHQIKHHPKEYYKKQLQINNSTQPPLNLRGGEEELKFTLFIAEYENKVIAANIVVVFGSCATYLHGATSNENREVMAPHLLQWEQIKYARQQGCAEYDFFGIVNEHTLDKRGASWEGFTRFKKGFGGREENYIGYFDYPLDKFWYFIYRLVQKLRR